jgi:hypothetical protein
MEFLFTDRFVVYDGTVYRRFLGNSYGTPKQLLDQQEDMFNQFVGQKIKINGKESKLLKVVIESMCNLDSRNYYICLLTDEEYKVKEVNYSI